MLYFVIAVGAVQGVMLCAKLGGADWSWAFTLAPLWFPGLTLSMVLSGFAAVLLMGPELAAQLPALVGVVGAAAALAPPYGFYLIATVFERGAEA